MTHEATIKITNPKPGEGNLLMTCDAVLCGYITLIGVRVWKNSENGSRFVSLPQRAYQKDGETRYANVVSLTESAMKALQKAVLAEYEAL